MRQDSLLTRSVILVVLFFLQAFAVHAQMSKWMGTTNDTAYVTDYSKALTVRLNVTRRSFSYTMFDDHLHQNISYKPNTPLNVGFGFNYKVIGLNFGYNLPSIGDNGKFGKTHVVDLSLHVYLRKFLIDLYGMSYNGFYLANTDNLKPVPYSNNYIRPDIHIRNVGLSVDYVFSPEKYSFRAAFLQNEHQKKSSGSFLAGADIHANYARGDSSFVPTALMYDNFLKDVNFNRTKGYSLAVNGGYAYTLVIKKRLFLLVSVEIGAGVSYTALKETSQDYKTDRFGPVYQATARMAAGYNYKVYFIGVHYTGLSMYSFIPYADGMQRYAVDNFRFSIARRFVLKKPLIGKF